MEQKLNFWQFYKYKLSNAMGDWCQASVTCFFWKVAQLNTVDLDMISIKTVIKHVSNGWITAVYQNLEKSWITENMCDATYLKEMKGHS